MAGDKTLENDFLEGAAHQGRKNTLPALSQPYLDQIHILREVAEDLQRVACDLDCEITSNPRVKFIQADLTATVQRLERGVEILKQTDLDAEAGTTPSLRAPKPDNIQPDVLEHINRVAAELQFKNSTHHEQNSSKSVKSFQQPHTVDRPIIKPTFAKKLVQKPQKPWKKLRSR